MAYKCTECGHIFEEGEQANWTEEHGEKLRGCPICKGVYEETVKCKVCGGEFLDEELKSGVCDDCIDEKKYDFDFCYSLAKTKADPQKIEINALLASLLDVSEIETIIYNHLKSSNIPVDCTNFIKEDEYWFAEELVKEVKE